MNNRMILTCISFCTLAFLAACEVPNSQSQLLANTVPGCDSQGTSREKNPHCVASDPQISFVRTVNIAGSEGNLVIDSRGIIFYPDVNAGNVMAVAPDGSQEIFATYGPTGGYATIAIDQNDVLYVSANGTIVKISPNKVVTQIGNGTSLMTAMGGRIALQMTVDHSGNIFYVEAGPNYVTTNVIKKVTPAGVVSTFAGSGSTGNAMGIGTAASFNNPQSLVTDSVDNLFVVDAGNFQIKKISPLGEVSLFAGSGSQGLQDGLGIAAAFNFRPIPDVHLAIDSSDNLYVADNLFDTGYIRKITPQKLVSTYCGNGSISDINVPGSCTETGVWVTLGLTSTPNGVLFYFSGQSLFRVQN